ncbi:MAG: hypothetical protein GX620_16560 [Chloroflexi bacterium]|nr:hypothetical protein [Chloroflexota bacterium]
MPSIRLSIQFTSFVPLWCIEFRKGLVRWIAPATALEGARVTVGYDTSDLLESSFVAASDARSFDPFTDAYHVEATVTATMTGTDAGKEPQVYSSALRITFDKPEGPPVDLLNPLGLEVEGTLDIPCGDRIHDKYRLDAVMTMLGFLGDQTIPTTTLTCSVEVDFTTGLIVDATLTGWQTEG